MKYMAKSREFGIRKEQGGWRKEKNMSIEVGLLSVLLVYLSINL